MATYKHPDYLTKIDHSAFDGTHKPGAVAPYSGIYRCMGCGSEVASNEGQPLPPQNHNQHPTHDGAISWKLIVYADHEKK
jgi:hypothetical protein